MISVNLILYSHIEWSCNRTFFLISEYMKISVMSVICKLMYKCWIAMECKYNWLILCKQCIIICI